jgi:hypothetical protein
MHEEEDFDAGVIAEFLKVGPTNPNADFAIFPNRA